MAVFVLLMFLMFSKSVLCQESLTMACNTDDIACLSKATELFLEKTHKGIPAYNIVTIDPLVIPSYEFAFDDENLKYKYTTLTVTGLRHQKISDFKMDTKAKSVVLTTQADLDMVGNVDITLTKSSRTLSGHYKLHARILGTATYNYELKTDEKGVNHFHVGPEKITCKVAENPTAVLSPEFQQILSNDPEAKTYNDEKRMELRKRMACKIAEKAYTNVVHNIRAAAKAVPSSAFFNNIQ
ncbi:juvenile hormone-binding protein-like [Leguminivora glycinivorella]|uniref:juvenile hormone-binding protein-like n=1 Tax=Leguminivora glycinivorella TaxID=1035111 RepID=UPI0020109BDA|nr:juvenile hormone-binding protein-like [Leguminivora glycinivorella]